MNIDLVDPDFDNKHSDILNSFETVIALNVVEHIEDDSLAISNINKLLKINGTCIILVPAFQALYNSFDRELCHFRRYNRRALNSLVSRNFKVIRSEYFNPIGTVGWFFNGNILRKKLIPNSQMQWFDKMVPLFKMINYLTKPFFGLSIISVGKKVE